MTTNLPPLKITEAEGDTIKVFLDPNKHPVAYQRKLYELVQQGMSLKEAEVWLMQAPIVLEMFYDINMGLFAVEAEAAQQCEIHNPYTGKEIPNDNLTYLLDNLKKIDDITCQLSNIRDELDSIHSWDKLTADGDEVIENAKSHLDDCLTEIHKFTDPDDKVGLIEEDQA